MDILNYYQKYKSYSIDKLIFSSILNNNNRTLKSRPFMKDFYFDYLWDALVWERPTVAQNLNGLSETDMVPLFVNYSTHFGNSYLITLFLNKLLTILKIRNAGIGILRQNLQLGKHFCSNFNYNVFLIKWYKRRIKYKYI